MEEQTAAEISAMQAIASALEPLDVPTRRRAVKWAMDRFVNFPAQDEATKRWLSLKARSRDEILSGKALS